MISRWPLDALPPPLAADSNGRDAAGAGGVVVRWITSLGLGRASPGHAGAALLLDCHLGAAHDPLHDPRCAAADSSHSGEFGVVGGSKGTHYLKKPGLVRLLYARMLV